MPINCKIENKYNLNEHAFVFSSIIFASIIVDLLSKDMIIDFILKHIPYLITFSYSAKYITVSGFLHFLWCSFFLIFIVQGWWASRLEQYELNSFISYLVFLSPPLLLFITENIVLTNTSFIDTDKSIVFFSLIGLILLNITFVRTYFGPINQKHTKKLKKENFYSVIRRKGVIVRIIFLIIIFSVIFVLLFYRSKFEHITFIVSAHLLFFCLANYALYKGTKDTEEVYNIRNYEHFINDLITMYLPGTLRDKKSYGFLLFNRKKVPDKKIEYILSQIRGSDVYNMDDSHISCFFLTGDRSISKFQSRLTEFANQTNAISNLEENQIVFEYQYYEENLEDYNQEFMKLFHIAYDKLKL